MKKYISYLLIGILLLSIAFAVSSTVSTFTNGKSSEQLNLTGRTNHSLQITFPSYAYIDNLSILFNTPPLDLISWWKMDRNTTTQTTVINTINITSANFNVSESHGLALGNTGATDKSGINITSKVNGMIVNISFVSTAVTSINITDANFNVLGSYPVTTQIAYPNFTISNNMIYYIILSGTATSFKYTTTTPSFPIVGKNITWNYGINGNIANQNIFEVTSIGIKEGITTSNNGTPNGYTFNNAQRYGNVVINSSGKYGNGIHFDGDGDYLNSSLNTIGSTYSYWQRNLSNGIWNHYLNSSGTFYKNGAVGSLDGQIFSFTYGLTIGNGFNGSLDNICIMNHSATPTEVEALYNSGMYPNASTPCDLLYISGENYNTTHVFDENHLTAGQYGEAMRFDGNGDYVNIPDNTALNISNQITLSAWIYQKSNNGLHPIIGKPIESYLYGISSGKIFAYINNGTTSDLYFFGANIQNTLNSWQMITVTADGTNVTLFVNGNRIRSETQLNDLLPVGANATIGWRPATTQYFNGSIDEVMIFNRSLTAEQIAYLHREQADKYYPTNFKIYSDNQLEYSNAEFSGNYTFSANITNLNNKQAQGTNTHTINLYSDNNAFLKYELSKANYSYGIDNCSNSFNIPSNATALNIFFFDENSGNSLAVDTNGILYYTDYGSNTYNLNTKNKINTSICIYPSWYSDTLSGFFYYSNEGYSTKSYTFVPTELNNITQTLNLYLFNSTSTNRGSLIVQVFDDFTNLITGANVKLLKYNTDLNSFEETSQYFSDTNGECIFDVELNTKFYIVTATATVNNQVYSAQSTSSGQLIKLDGTTIELHLKTSESFTLDDLFDLVIIPSNTSLVGNTSYLKATFNDASNNNHTVCVGYYIRTGTNEAKQTSTCVSGSSGIVNAAGGYVLDRDYTWVTKIYVIESNGKIRVYNSYTYNSLSSSAQAVLGYWLKPLIFLALLSLLAIALYMKNMVVFAIGEMVLSPFTIYIYPGLIGGVTMSFLIIMGIIIIFFSSRKEEQP